MANELGIWHEVFRRLHDGVMLRTSPVLDHPDKVYVMIQSFQGYMMYSGTMPIIDALTEIPYQLDRARVMDEQTAVKREAENASS